MFCATDCIYGETCPLKCNCLPNEGCDSQTGVCDSRRCPPGLRDDDVNYRWTGPSCQIGK